MWNRAKTRKHFQGQIQEGTCVKSTNKTTASNQVTLATLYRNAQIPLEKNPLPTEKSVF